MRLAFLTDTHYGGINEGFFLQPRWVGGMPRLVEQVQRVLDETDPVPRFEKRVVKARAMTKTELGSIRKRVYEELRDALEFARISPAPEASALFEDLYV